ncbi:DUF2948 family protein [Xanthobacter sp. TB0139]|uniref:DUF2948 family protein n=1 Tax=Xanthobacter sp. TB0139 TaxID=3459178 RepID=UPI004039A4B9
MSDLKLLALDEEDLSIISAHLQDAVVQRVDMGFLPRAQRFALVLNRFDWDESLQEGAQLRRRAGLHFERVRGVQCRGMDVAQQDGVLNLLAVTFIPGDAPSGHVLLTFSGGAEVRLDVECIEVGLGDLGPAWGCAHAPHHEAERGDKPDAGSERAFGRMSGSS